MFANITEKIVSNMEKQNMIQTNRRDIYKYGFSQMFNMLLNMRLQCNRQSRFFGFVQLYGRRLRSDT